MLRKLMKQPRRLVPYTVRTLAEQVDANRTTIGYFLTGKRPSVDLAVAKGIAEAFGVPFDELFERDESSSQEGDFDVVERAS